jgi:heme-degrading monooxygenase HmoA
MATEIALLKLKADSNVNDASSAAGKSWQESLKDVLSQPGAQRAYWGTSEETPTMLRLFIDWDSVDSHKNFMSSDSYAAFGGKLMSLLDGVEGVSHANLTPHPPSAALSEKSSPATELLTVYFPKDYSSAQQEKFAADFKQLEQAIKENGKDHYVASAGGWCVEEEVVNPANKEIKGKAFFAAIGWRSVQHHLDFRNTSAFKENIHLLRGAEGLLGLHVEHYHGKEVRGGQ